MDKENDNDSCRTVKILPGEIHGLCAIVNVANDGHSGTDFSSESLSRIVDDVGYKTVQIWMTTAYRKFMAKSGSDEFGYESPASFGMYSITDLPRFMTKYCIHRYQSVLDARQSGDIEG